MSPKGGIRFLRVEQMSRGQRGGSKEVPKRKPLIHWPKFDFTDLKMSTQAGIRLLGPELGPLDKNIAP